MAAREQNCLVCGKVFTIYDAAPSFYCSVGCAADAGASLKDEAPYVVRGRGRAATVARIRGKHDQGNDQGPA